MRGALDFATMIEEDAETRHAQRAWLGNDPGGAGVSRRTVARKRTRFLGIACQQLAAVLAAAALAGCASGLAHADAVRGGPPRDAPQAPLERARGDGGATGGDARSAPDDSGSGDLTALAERIHTQVAQRMARHGPALHRRVAQAVVTEAKRASVDPLLVLAVIQVESSFDPHAVSSAGAVGLMQLLEPTMRSELERSGLAPADPRDPVANVQAGVRYLRRLLDAFDGELDTALMAYNAGPSRIRGHLREGGIPERFHVYPRKVRGELERLRTRLARDTGSATARRSTG